MSSDRAYGPTTPSPRCEEHAGAHARYLGRCYAVGAQVPRPVLFSRTSWDCDCGRRVYGTLVRATLRRYLVDELTGEEHRCPPAVRVQLDADLLADALGTAVDRLVERRQPPPSQPLIVPPQPPREPPSRNGTLGSIPRFES